ncbi:hypothetical protein [Oceanibaculum nanhaiense]|jgi:hypothetical protein|uniref:hypothetical protein n=1 Tax=Oceanibaculum nanhaiense TaxID=1909734 RepID=UPI003D27A926
MSGPRIIILAEYPTPEIVEAHLRRAHRLRAIAFARWLHPIRQRVKRLFALRRRAGRASRPRIAVKRPQPRLNLPRQPALH